jgi:hypothetical protein
MSYQYTTLICSLPSYESLFASKQAPISRIQLEKRLQLLTPQDYSDIQRMMHWVEWRDHAFDTSDEQLIADIQAVLPLIVNDGVRELVEWRLNWRSVIAAVRRKLRGDPPPPKNSSWGMSPWLDHMQRHWQQPYLGLEKHLPWVVELTQLLQAEKHLPAEHFILHRIWQALDVHAFEHEFDLQAVAIYCMRWDLLIRWSSYNSNVAHTRFTALVNDAVSNFTMPSLLNTAD